VIQPEPGSPPGKDHPVKGKWKNDIFKNTYPVILELGCGKGEYTTGLSERFPERNHIGIDIKGARMWRGARTTKEKNISNAAFLRTRIEFISFFFEEDEVDEIWLTFPDPQSGKKNSNKRLTCPWFLNIYRKFLKNNGIINLKTDSTELFNYTRSVVEMNRLPVIRVIEDIYSDYPADDILTIRTHYEDMFLREGRKIHFLSFRLPKNLIIEDIISKLRQTQD
jgi:tRNA (guanine-N7-)-methyltransferase